MLNEIIANLGSNYKSDQAVLEKIIEDITAIASQISNRETTDTKLKSYIKTAVISTYLLRGDEGKSSSSEGGISASYEDIIEKLRTDIVKNGVRRVK